MSLVIVTLAAASAEDVVVAAAQLRPVPVAAVVIPLMVAVFFLLRSMNKQLKRIDFDESAETDEGRADRSPNTPRADR